jgi:hypothetical protein
MYSRIVQSVMTGYGLKGRSSIPVMCKRFISSPKHSDLLWGPTIILFSEYRGQFPLGKSGRGVKLTTHLPLVPRSKMVELYLHSLHVFMAWYLTKHRDFTVFHILPNNRGHMWDTLYVCQANTFSLTSLSHYSLPVASMREGVP